MLSEKLLILPSLKAKRLSDTEVLITHKFLDGVLAYQKNWPGSIAVWLEEIPTSTNNLDNQTVDITTLPFELKLVNLDALKTPADLEGASVVLASEGYRQTHISQLCQASQIPCIYVTEYSVKTQHQIIDATTNDPLRRLRRHLWVARQHQKQRRAIALADGVQCNGVPTYEAYRLINDRALLYFDTRFSETMLATPAEMAERMAPCLAHQPLRLFFSGRLIPEKGADHLIQMAQALRALDIPFELTICGDGSLKSQMVAQIADWGLGDVVKMLGVLDFDTELVPFVKKNVDLFVCCHRQGDPSCTYLETMGCGVPIVGYDNEAWVGVMQYAQTGWRAPMNQPRLLAQKIAELHAQRAALAAASYQALAFAQNYTMEKTFVARTAHIRAIAARKPSSCP